jgi:hypothetical protein
VAEEVAPAMMKREWLLSWGFGEHLSTALLSLYGGYVLQASDAVRELATSVAPAQLEGMAALSSIDAAPAAFVDDVTFIAVGLPKPKWGEMRGRVMTR